MTERILLIHFPNITYFPNISVHLAERADQIEGSQQNGRAETSQSGFADEERGENVK